MNWRFTYQTKGDNGKNIFCSFSEADAAFRQMLKDNIRTDDVAETFRSFGSDDEEAVENYQRIVKSVQNFISGAPFRQPIETETDYYDDNYYYVKCGECFFEVGDSVNACGEYDLFDENDDKIEQPQLGPYFMISWNKVDEGYEYDFEMILYEITYRFSLKKQIEE